MISEPGIGFAACPLLADQEVVLRCFSDAVEAARQAAASISLPRFGNPLVAYAWEGQPGLAARLPKGESEQSRCPLGYTVDQDPNLYKVYPPVRLVSIQSTFMPWNVIKTYLKNLGVVALININLWVWEALEAEERAIQQNLPPEAVKAPPFPDLDPMVRKAMWNSWRELLTTCVRRLYEHQVAARSSARTAWKTLKDWRASISRKASWYGSYHSYQLVPIYSRTIARCTLLLYAADWTVSCLYEVVDAGRAVHKKICSPEKAALVLATHVSRHTLRCTATWTISAIGAAAVASLFSDRRAGRAAVIGHFVIDTLVNPLVLMVMDGTLAGLWEQLAAGGRGKGAAGGPHPQQQQQQQQGEADAGAGGEGGGLAGAGAGWGGPGGGQGGSNTPGPATPDQGNSRAKGGYGLAV